MLTIPMNYTSFGGTYTIQTGINAGSQVFGQDPLWLAWVTDLINFQDAGNTAAYSELMATVIPARFKVGQMIGATGLLLGIALAMYLRTCRIPHRCNRAAGIYVYVLRPSVIHRLCGTAGLCICHGGNPSPAASFLWKSGVYHPCSHVLKGRARR